MDSIMTDEESEDELLLKNDVKDVKTRILSFLKLMIILGCYGFAFISLAQWGIWISDDSDHDPSAKVDFLDWVKEFRSGFYGSMTLMSIAKNSGLLLLFLCQHSLMSERVLSGSKYWDCFHHNWKIDKAIYNFMTGAALQAVVRLWSPTPVCIWEVSAIKDYFKYAHILAWASFYGTNLMLDLPDLIGLNQVVISSPTLTVKSPELRKLYKSQRHMGLIPLTIILLAYPYMSLDRFLLLVTSVSYMYFCWRSEESYEYAREMRRVKKQRID